MIHSYNSWIKFLICLCSRFGIQIMENYLQNTFNYITIIRIIRIENLTDISTISKKLARSSHFNQFLCFAFGDSVLAVDIQDQAATSGLLSLLDLHLLPLLL